LLTLHVSVPLPPQVFILLTLTPFQNGKNNFNSTNNRKSFFVFHSFLSVVALLFIFDGKWKKNSEVIFSCLRFFFLFQCLSEIRTIPSEEGKGGDEKRERMKVL
jgi:hypothetical protein